MSYRVPSQVRLQPINHVKSQELEA
ncbi:uncharacterized protein FFMR_01845 [Fusarium fujikuroi]|nr:uncharacterized protein FFE2_00383 [Fusarium fujikuroi]SCN69211.1 uncharacterized protein FFC1_00378 [Fusarium fujikuroi]SCN72210.1 uncharacterized protein FFM5_00347 [Fusarium fujikuroi]SCO28522.1 uncharacterized protein FFNC_00383 [Fusarium fujikuroi]SCO30530.1 uncharacterized protein FFMR_01845 [Fusarium fujikuroi]